MRSAVKRCGQMHIYPYTGTTLTFWSEVVDVMSMNLLCRNLRSILLVSSIGQPRIAFTCSRRIYHLPVHTVSTEATEARFELTISQSALSPSCWIVVHCACNLRVISHA